MKNTKGKLPVGWQSVESQKCIINKSIGKSKIHASTYLKEGKYPIIDQGANHIAGYTNDESLVYKHEGPVVVFGDHTRIFKYIDFNFAIGADGTKIIHPNLNVVNPQYLYFVLKSADFPDDGYSRHYKYLKFLKIPLPPTLDDQIRIANELEHKMAEIEKMRQAALSQKEAIAAMQGAILREVFPYKAGDKLPEGWWWEKIGSHILDYQSGLARGDKSKLEGYPHLRMNNISKDFKLDLTLLWRIPASEVELDKYCVKQGDILFNNTNSAELVGKSCLFNLKGTDKFLFSNHLTRIRTKETLRSQYLLYWINVFWQRQHFEENCDKWVNQAAARVEDLLFPLDIAFPPSIDDQIAIASELERKMAEIEKMRHAADNQLEAIEALPGAILRVAFDFEEEEAS